MSDLSSPARSPAFLTTRWSLVIRAAGDVAEHPEATAALESLCGSYWHPIYCYVRRQGHPPEAAEDLTQDFFVHVLRRPVLAHADPEKGRFRSYLLGVLKNVMFQGRDRESAGKRGGGAVVIRLDALDAEARYRLEPVDTDSPEFLFDRRWAATVMALARQRLRKEYAAAGQADRFDTLKGFLVTGPQTATYAEAAAALGLSEAALKSAIFRLRQRFAAALRAEIAETVAAESEIDGEIRHLAKVLGA